MLAFPARNCNSLTVMIGGNLAGVVSSHSNFVASSPGRLPTFLCFCVHCDIEKWVKSLGTRLQTALKASWQAGRRSVEAENKRNWLVDLSWVVG